MSPQYFLKASKLFYFLTFNSSLAIHDFQGAPDIGKHSKVITMFKSLIYKICKNNKMVFYVIKREKYIMH